MTDMMLATAIESSGGVGGALPFEHFLNNATNLLTHRGIESLLEALEASGRDMGGWARAVVKHNPECVLRLACEGVSFLPRVMQPLVVLAPLPALQTNLLLRSADLGACDLQYPSCPLFSTAL
ncbi:uncharacterized protein LOC122249282 isoform X3 [Penaeus japonicus]|uniref:uncharacterized protein LOC122249282 isoform X3 n=1 Tax=Penaeus japonicus TaxID=27405 RepID=UPI001C70FE4F|nr:uncharacterized protein LOC122249282 isoform X3 [Penaeus japonicus]